MTTMTARPWNVEIVTYGDPARRWVITESEVITVQASSWDEANRAVAKGLGEDREAFVVGPAKT
jgi:hypothetical protein